MKTKTQKPRPRRQAPALLSPPTETARDIAECIVAEAKRESLRNSSPGYEAHYVVGALKAELAYALTAIASGPDQARRYLEQQLHNLTAAQAKEGQPS